MNDALGPDAPHLDRDDDEPFDWPLPERDPHMAAIAIVAAVTFVVGVLIVWFA